MTNPGYTRRQELTCTLAELETYAGVVLYNGEVLYVKQADDTYDVKIGDGTTPVGELPYVVRYTDIQNALEEARRIGVSKYRDVNDPSYWIAGTINKSTGNLKIDASLTRSLVTENFIPAESGMISADYPYEFSVFAWDADDAFVGVWGGEAFAKGQSATEAYVDAFDLSVFDELGYKFKAKAKHKANKTFDEVGGPEQFSGGVHFVNRLYHIYDKVDEVSDEVARVSDTIGLSENLNDPSLWVAGNLAYSNGAFTETGSSTANTLYCHTPTDAPIDAPKGTRIYFEYPENYKHATNGKITVYHSVDGGVTFTSTTDRSWAADTDCKVVIKIEEYVHKSGVTVVTEFPQYLAIKKPNEIERLRYNSSPVVTFIDDDCHDESLNNWETIADDTGIKPTIAVPTNTPDASEWNKIKRLWCKGFEFVSHSHTHEKLTDVTDDYIEEDLALSVKAFHENGINPRFLVYPGNATNPRVINIVKKYFVGAFMGENKVNTANIEPFRLFRVSINHPSNKVSVTYPGDSAPTECYAFKTEEDMRKVIDEAIAKNGWLIVMTHLRNDGGFYFDDSVKTLVENTIKYAAARGCEVLTAGEAYDRFRNRVTCVNYSNYTISYRVDCDGYEHR